jgi:thiol-disulfide isomerase/thioredoxin
MAIKLKRELIEWLVLIGIVVGLYVTGLHKEVAGQLQRLILATHIMTPTILEEEEKVVAVYNFQLKDINGNDYDFNSLRGKTIFLNFWATWCPPCIAEMPDIQDLYNQVNADVVFVMISRDNQFEKAKAFVDKKGFSFPIYQMNGQLPEMYFSKSIPTTFVISSDGNLVSKTTGMAKYDTESFKEFLLNL